VPSEARPRRLQADRGAFALGAADRADLAVLDMVEAVERDEQVRRAPRRRGPFGKARVLSTIQLNDIAPG